MKGLWTVICAFGVGAAYVAQTVRWLRVLQREHYEPSSLPRFWRRWTWASWRDATIPALRRRWSLNLAGVLWCTLPAALVVALIFHAVWVVVVATVLYGGVCPRGLGLRGRTGRLEWTRRLRTVALVGLLISAAGTALGAVGDEALLAGALVVWAVPFTLALAAQVLGPHEARRAQSFVEQAHQRLERVDPVVVAITGSYGKTSTKNHLAALLGIDGGVVATPKSFNNRAGLSRAINENLADGTRVFVAEMGTYGPGEIRELCQWCPPDIAVVTAIGPVHLERMKSLDVIEAAKFEVTERARVVVVNIDDPRLANWPARLVDRRVRTASSRSPSDVRVAIAGDLWHVWIEGHDVAQLRPIPGVQPTNVACAVAAALEVGARASEISRRLSGVGPVDNRANVVRAASGVVVVDDTFNANPASARAALEVLASVTRPGRGVVVTPGLVELGAEQNAYNEALARQVAEQSLELVIVGRTNEGALTQGYAKEPRRFRRRDDAVTWVRETLVLGDAVLYLNDLPDHYP